MAIAGVMRSCERSVRFLRAAARVNDVAARIGGDEFALLLPDTDTWGAEVAAGRIADGFCAATEALDIPCTVSMGISSSETTDRRSLIADADAALHRDMTPERHGTDRWSTDDGAR